MAIWPLQSAGVGVEGGALTASSLLTTVTASATIHAKGAWVTMIASTGFAASEVIVQSPGALNVTAIDTSTLFEVAIGAAGSEVVVVPEIACGHSDANGYWNWRFPVAIPAGSRVSMRTQSAVVSKTITAQVRLLGGGVVPPEASAASGDGYGMLTASSGGTVLTVATTINVKSAWTQLTASTIERARFMHVNIQPVAGTVVTTGNGLVDIGVGAAAAEQVVVANVPYAVTGVEAGRYAAITVPVTIPAGVRLAARYQADGIAVGTRPRVAVVMFA